ncbi:MAG: helix-turn-helix domain-containing protein [Muribaculaceae bacterium]|nr:helix-turn-helix domain-containing protein [Muribaculaceae bacterium]
MLFSETIKRLRIDSGKRQADLARAIGVDVPAYSRFEHGERRPKREQVLRLARLFKVDANELIAQWLADEAYSRIAHDKMSGQAAALLCQMLDGNASVSTIATKRTDSPTPENVRRDLVAGMGRSSLPLMEQGDAATVMQRIEDESIDCIVTTPPYWRRRSQGTEGITASSQEEFLEELKAVMTQAWRVLKPQGSLWLNLGDDTVDGFVQCLPWRLVLDMIDRQGWRLVNEVIWNKIKTSPQGSQDHLRKVHESMFHLVKDEDFYYNDEELRHIYALIIRNEEKSRTKTDKRRRTTDGTQGIIPSDVWTIATQHSGTARYRVAPDMLYRLPIVATCPRNGIVLDPYCGSGTACRIAYELNRRSIGIDINAEFIRKARASIEQKPLSLF